MSRVFAVLVYYGVAWLCRAEAGLLSSMPSGWARRVQEFFGAGKITAERRNDRDGAEDGHNIHVAKMIAESGYFREEHPATVRRWSMYTGRLWMGLMHVLQLTFRRSPSMFHNFY